MRITREIFDNDKKIVHVNFDKIDLESIRRKIESPSNIKPQERQMKRPEDGNLSVEIPTEETK